MSLLIMKYFLLFVFLPTTVFGCRVREKPQCNETNLEGFFLLADGTGTFRNSWKMVVPFINSFKNVLPSDKPVWLVQWSAHCVSLQGYKCAEDTHITKLSPGWTNQDFDNGVNRTFGVFHGRLTENWYFINESASIWLEYKKEHKLGKDARALMVFLSDGEDSDTEREADAVKNFKDGNMKFLGVYQKDYPNFNFDHYKQLMDNPTTDLIEVQGGGVDLGQELAKRIVVAGCAKN